jgi:FG-GAP-like repeat
MLRHRRLLGYLALLCLIALTADALAYVEAPHSLGQVVSLSSNIVVMRVEAVDKEKNAIIYRKVRDIKGVHKQEQIRHNIGNRGFEPREWQTVMNWAEVGKTAIFFHNGGQSETCLGTYWYQCDGNSTDPNAWWSMTHGEPYLLRSFAGSVDKLIVAATAITANQEVIVPCMIDGNKEDLKARRAKIQRLKASLKLDYNPKRDFVGWGGEDFRRLSGMPGFTHISALPRVDPDAQSIAALDFNGDGKPDLCLSGGARVALLQNAGESLNETSLPLSTGARASVWADYNGDGLPDLLLATPAGPRLFTNTGKGFRDDTHLLPREAGYDLTAAAWIDYDGDGRPDILLGNGFHGLRLYRNKGEQKATPSLALGAWHHIGPFDNRGGRGFDAAYAPEKEINLTKKYRGKDNEEVAWAESQFTDGQNNNLALFKSNEETAVYLYRRIDCAKPMKLPVSLGSDDTLTVWLNGKKIVAQNESRACTPDQARPVLDLQAGKNDFLMKVCNGSGPWEFYFKAIGEIPPAMTWSFEDVSDSVGLGASGIGSNDKGDTLTVCDVDGDGRPDFLYGSGKGLLVMNTPKGFVAAVDSGIDYETGKAGPVFGDFDADGLPDLIVPQSSGVKLFRNLGKGKFADVTAKVGLANLNARVACAAWGDVDNDGRLDLVLGCLRGPNRYLRNKGDGTFEDASEALGLQQRVFNTQAVCLVDLNGDGVLDMVFNNEGQDSCVLLGNPEVAGRKTPVTLRLAGKQGITGSRVHVLDSDGKLLASHHVSGGDGRGGQAAPTARFALTPGKYRVEFVLSSGERRARELTVASSHVKEMLDETTTKVE